MRSSRPLCRESYNDASAVYEALKHRGMDLVTITDHDSIGAAEALRRPPDFFLTTWASTALRRRSTWNCSGGKWTCPRLIAYLAEQNLFFTVNHVSSSLTGARTDLD